MPQVTLDTETVVQGIARLRKIAPQLDERSRQELDPVITLLEDLAGPTVNRSQAARLLGVSHTTLNRWISKGDITTVPTSRGRREIPLGQLVHLLGAVAGGGGESRDLALVIQDQRRRAADLDVASLLPARSHHGGGHRKPELRSLAYHRAVAQRLDDQIVADAKRRLRRWQGEGRIHPNWAGEWARILNLPLRQIARILAADTEHARSLRQSSPFAGVLTEHERRRVLDGVEELTR